MANNSNGKSKGGSNLRVISVEDITRDTEVVKEKSKDGKRGVLENNVNTYSDKLISLNDRLFSDAKQLVAFNKALDNGEPITIKDYINNLIQSDLNSNKNFITLNNLK